MYEGDEGGNKAKVRMCWETKKQKTELTGFQVRLAVKVKAARHRATSWRGVRGFVLTVRPW